MSIHEIKPLTLQANEQVVAALEEMLALARRGKINHLLAIGTEETTRRSHRVFAHELDVTLIGMLHITLTEIQADFVKNLAIPAPDSA